MRKFNVRWWATSAWVEEHRARCIANWNIENGRWQMESGYMPGVKLNLLGTVKQASVYYHGRGLERLDWLRSLRDK